MKICTYCGAQIPDTARFCNICGSQVAQAADMQQDYMQQPYYTAPMPSREPQPPAPQPVATYEPPATPQESIPQQPPAPSREPEAQIQQSEYVPPQPPAPAQSCAPQPSRPPRRIWPRMRTRIKRLLMLSVRLAFLSFTLVAFISSKKYSGTDNEIRYSGDYLSPEAAAIMAEIDEDAGNSPSTIEALKVSIKATVVEVKAKGVDHYLTGKKISGFWGLLMSMGIVFFAWNDLRMAIKFGHMSGVEADKTTFYWDVFVNGAYSYSYKTQGLYILTFPFVTLFTFIILALIFPLRFFINILMDVVGIISGSEKMGNFSVIGNVVASIALYTIVLSLLSGAKDHVIALIVSGIIFIAACIVNRFNLF